MKLLQTTPTIFETDDDEDGFAISRQSYEKLNKYKMEMEKQSEYKVDVEQSESEDTELCYSAEIKVR